MNPEDNLDRLCILTEKKVNSTHADVKEDSILLDVCHWWVINKTDKGLVCNVNQFVSKG